MSELAIVGVVLSVLGLLQVLQLFILSDLRARVVRLEDRYINRRQPV